MKERILAIIASETIYSYEDIETIYEETKSYDTTIELCNVCTKAGMSVQGILSFVRLYKDTASQLVRVGLPVNEARRKLREAMMSELNKKQEGVT